MIYVIIIILCVLIIILTQKTLKKEKNKIPINTSNLYIDRLVSEWQTHTKIVLAIDYDSTISYWKTIENTEDITRCISLIRRIQNSTYNVIHTAGNEQNYDEIRHYCKKIGIRIDSINVNPINLPYGKNTKNDSSKVFYNHQLCDRSGFVESMDILESSYYIYMGKIRNKILDNLSDLG